MNWRKNVITRKAVRYLNACRREWIYHSGEPDAPPPVVVNSFPKSGTHLLVEIVQELTDTRDWGLFLASQPSFTFRPSPVNRITRVIDRLASRELVGAHLHYDERIAEHLLAKNAIHLFIKRDLRAVAVSEAHYLKSFNPWHALHRYYRKIDSTENAIRFAMLGNEYLETPYDYPNIFERFAKYRNWTTHANCLSFDYESISEAGQHRDIERISTRLVKSGYETDCVDQVVSRLNPEKSHTFRKGEAFGWQEEITPSLQETYNWLQERYSAQ